MSNTPKMEKNFSEAAQTSEPQGLVVPTVVEETAQGRASYDIFSRVLKDRIIKLDGPIDDTTASLITTQLLILEAQDPGQDINLYINSPGGSVSAGMAIFDTMKQIKCDVVTIGMGTCASMGSFLLAAGTKGKRFALPNTRVMTHQPSAGTQGKVTDMVSDVEEFQKTKEKMRHYYLHFLDVTPEEFETMYERDTWMNALAAEKMGHIDQVIMKGPDPEDKLSEDEKALFKLELELMEQENKEHKVIAPIVARIEAEEKAQSGKAAPTNDNSKKAGKTAAP
jgi:ATP-dependent Clp protease protease subunit